jgi:hypothetical protein
VISLDHSGRGGDELACVTSGQSMSD